MSSPPPLKPPRGVKQGKETSGLLMSVIRTLSASETNEQREKERAKLEKEYKKSDARLDELVACNAQEIMEVMQKFSAVNTALGQWDALCSSSTSRVAACRSLLRLKRDDLQRLWVAQRTHHHALTMLTDIERVVVSERSARESMQSGRVLAAATTLRAAIAAADDTLHDVTALHTTRQHLQAMKRELVDMIVSGIKSAVYRDDRVPFTRRMSSRRRANLLLTELTKNEEVTDAYLQDITPEFEASLTDDDKTFETTVMISLEALGVLEQLKEATEKFKVQIQNELLEVIACVSRRIIDEGEIEPEGGESEWDGDSGVYAGVSETERPLAVLLETLGEELRAAATRNRRLIILWKAALQKHRISDSCLHTEQHYWSAVQQVLQLLLTEYLEIESVTLAAQRSSTTASDGTTDLRISDYFAKKKPNRRKPKLFKLSEPAPDVLATRALRYPLVCRPAPSLLYAALHSVHALCRDIEPLTGGGECSLRAFMTDYVRTGESERLARAARVELDTNMRLNNAWRERSTVQWNNAQRVVFTCATAAWRIIRSAALSARRCGACGGRDALAAVRAACAALAEHARAQHGRVRTQHSRAAAWLMDDDIVRFLQALPNWKVVCSADQPTAQELTQAYEREAEILGSSLGDGAVTKKEIICDINTLADIAVLCESMDWLSSNIKSIPSIVSAPSPGGWGVVKITDKFNNEIQSVAMIFDEISQKCLLLLHLEYRIQCFYYLGQEEPASVSAGAEGGGAARLAAALLACHDQVNSLLEPHRRAYVEEGLGEMMSIAVVWLEQARGGAGRLAPLRHLLAALRLPLPSLARAARYLQLLDQAPQDIIGSVREKGPQFSELEYLNAFKIIGTRRGISELEMKSYLKQLSTALGHIGVTV